MKSIAMRIRATPDAELSLHSCVGVSGKCGLNAGPGVQWAYNTVLKTLVCLALFCGTDLLKTLAAKSLARTFHKEAHFAKMKDALEKVPWPVHLGDGPHVMASSSGPRLKPEAAGTALSCQQSCSGAAFGIVGHRGIL